MSGSFLLGLPGKIGTLLTRLSDTRATKLDNLDAAVTTRSAAATALSTVQWTSARAAKLDSLATVPITNGVVEGSAFMPDAALDTLVSGLTTASTSSTSFADAVNYTGPGVLLFAAVKKTAQNTTMEVILDGVTAISVVANGSSGDTAIAVGMFCGPTATPILIPEPIAFRTSLQIQHKTASAVAPSVAIYRYRETA